MIIDQQYLTGLFLYLRMLQLSFDRVSGGNWEDLYRFLQNQPNPRDVLDSISVKCGFVSIPTSSPLPLSSKNSPSEMHTLNNEELSYICWWLLQTIKVIDRSGPVSANEDLSNLRCNLAYAEELVRTRLGKQDQTIDYVEHFGQNEILKCHPIDHLVGGAWPNL